MRGLLMGMAAALALGGCAADPETAREETFVRHMGQVAIPNTSLALLTKDREELLRRGHAACDGIAAGKSEDELEAATGLAGVDEFALVEGARTWLCPSR